MTAFKIILNRKLEVIIRDHILIPLLIMSPFLFSSCENDPPGPITEKWKAPDFHLESLDGDSLRLSSLEGKVVVLFFFGYDCSVCQIAAMEIENELMQPYSESSDFILLGLDLYNGSLPAIRTFKSLTSISFPLLMNASGLAAPYETTIDRIMVVDKEGYVSFKGEQLAVNDLEAVLTTVDMLLNE